jgi:hypothetical protein
METLQCRMRIATLWVLSAVAMSAHMILMSLDPVPMRKTAEWAAAAGPGDWMSVAVFWLVPLWMAFAATAMKDSVNRRINLVVAAALTILNAYHFVICGVPLMAGGPYERPTAHHALLVGSTVAATALIFFYAWKWPRPEVREKGAA